MKLHRKSSVCLAIAAVALIVAGCGGGGSGESSEAAQAAAEPAGPSPVEQGQAMGEEILAAFDEVVAEAVQLMTDKPDPETLLPQLEDLFTRAEARMTELNVRYLELRAADVEAFGAANSYLDDNRPMRIHAKDEAFSPFISHYRFEKPNQEVEEFLIGGSLAQLIDLATKKS